MCSPSSLTGKKSNELIQGGLSSLKSAANTLGKKFDEIKERISTSANSTPVKMMMSQGERLGAGDVGENVAGGGEGESTDGSEGGERHRKISAELGSARDSCNNLRDYDGPLPDNAFPPANEDPAGNFFIVKIKILS